jgi:hypothetical protein
MFNSLLLFLYMPLNFRTCFLALVTACALAHAPASAQTTAAPPPTGADLVLFAVEITTGPKWDAAKPAVEQLHFREHSVNLKRLRDAGHLVLGARYSDKGLVLLAAKDEGQARAMMDEDLSMQAQVFQYQLHPFNVFYGGSVAPKPRRP